MKTVDFSEPIAASNLKVSRSRYLIEYMMRYVSIEGQGDFLTLAQGRPATRRCSGLFHCHTNGRIHCVQNLADHAD